jgi:hypothetical protein
MASVYSHTSAKKAFHIPIIKTPCKRLCSPLAVLLVFALLLSLAPSRSFADGSASKSGAKPAPAGAEVSDAQIFNLKADPIVLDGYYTFITQAGNAIALGKASIKNGTGMVLKKNAKGSVGRKFFLISSPNGYHAVKNSISFKALSIKGNSEKDGAKLIQSTYKKDKGQRFKLVPSDDGWYLLKTALGTYVSATSDKAKAKIITTGDQTKALKVRVKETQYSSGMSKLDSKLKKIRKDVGSKGDIMKKGFNYVIAHYDYRQHADNFKGDWVSRYAWYMMSKKHGHCKNFASTLCVLYRSYGYDARVVTGHIKSASRGWATHGWLEVTIKGKTYICDPSMANARGIKGWYKRTYKNSPIEYRIEKRW